MQRNTTRLAFALILILGGSVAEKSLKTHLPEDALFWADRELQDGDMSVPVTPDTPVPTGAPVTPPTDSEVTPPETEAPTISEVTVTEAPTVTPVTEAPTSSEVTPPETAAPTSAEVTPPAGECGLKISISCTTGEGIECADYQVTGDLCLQAVTYTYTFANTGSAAIEITEASSQITGKEANDLIGLITPTTIEPGTSTTVQEQNRVDYCSSEATTTTVTAKATPEPCEATATLPIGGTGGGTEGGRRALRAN